MEASGRKRIIYNASSPDEKALIYFAKLWGYSYEGIDENDYSVISTRDCLFNSFVD